MEPEIIVGIDREQRSDDAIALAVWLARSTSAPLRLVGVYDALLGPGAASYQRALRGDLDAELQRAAALVPDDVRVSTQVIGSSSAARGLHEVAEHSDSAVLVLGPTHLGRVGRALRGDVARSVLQAAPCAVAVAPSGFAARPTSSDRVPLIGVAYVPSPEGDIALEAAIDQARRHHGHLRVLHVAVAPPPRSPAGATDSVRAHALEALDGARAAVGDRVPCEAMALEGRTAERLLEAAAELDLLVLGSRGYGPLGRMVLGSVSAAMVHTAPCPLLIVARGTADPR